MTTEVTLNADGTLSGSLGEAHLTNKEMALLVAVAGRKGGTLTKNAAMTELYGGMGEPEVKIIDVFICKVRNKLNEVGGEGAIETVRGQGYRWSKDFRLLLPDGGFVYMEVDTDLSQRLEDLALASGCNVSSLLYRIVTENLGDYEAEVWT